jgi:cell division protein FtsI (penicillin-binding protein 3)
MNAKKVILIRVYIAFFLVFVLGAVIIGKIVKLQVVDAPALKQLAYNMNTRMIDIQPIRGNIYAADGSLLATSIPRYELHLDMMVEYVDDDYFKENIDSLSWCLSNFFKDKSAAQYKLELKTARKNQERYYLLKRDVNHTQLKEIKTFPIFRLGRYKSGLIVVEKTRRELPFAQLCRRTIGYINEDSSMVGLEAAYNTYLSGKNGSRLMQKSSGAWIPVNDENELDPKDGQDIFTTLDVNFQDITENALNRALIDNGAEHGCAIVMEVSTGKIKAIANLTRDGENVYKEKYNYGIGASTEPGSTFKLASVMALLDMNKATPGTIIDANGGEITYFDKVMKDATMGEHNITLEEAFEHSSNVAISKAVYQAFSKEPDKYTDFIYKLGLASPLGLSIPGEGSPVVKTPHDKDWSGTTLPWMSIGYEIRLTPLQILSLYNAVANNGVMVRPQFITEIRDVGQLVQKFDTKVINQQVCSPRTLEQLKKMMEGVVEKGTATNLRNDLYKIAGKTGTAQIAKDNSGYAGDSKKQYQSSFVGYFPANKPMYSIIVVVNNPTKGIFYGGAVAAPVFKEIADKIYARTASTHSYLASFTAPQTDMPFVATMCQEHLSALDASIGTGKNNIPAFKNSWVQPQQDNGKIKVIAYDAQKYTVPDTRGMVLTDAIYTLENVGLRVRFSGKGRVSTQSLEPGSKFSKSDVISIILN